GQNFNGAYTVTRTVHRYDQDGYMTRFWVTSGQSSGTLGDLLRSKNGHEKGGPMTLGCVVGLVTNITDPENMGRVRVKFPWLSEDEESWWCRLVMPMTGAGRGHVYFPEVNDE